MSASKTYEPDSLMTSCSDFSDEEIVASVGTGTSSNFPIMVFAGVSVAVLAGLAGLSFFHDASGPASGHAASQTTGASIAAGIDNDVPGSVAAGSGLATSDALKVDVVEKPGSADPAAEQTEDGTEKEEAMQPEGDEAPEGNEKKPTGVAEDEEKTDVTDTKTQTGSRALRIAKNVGKASLALGGLYMAAKGISKYVSGSSAASIGDAPPPAAVIPQPVAPQAAAPQAQPVAPQPQGWSTAGALGSFAMGIAAKTGFDHFRGSGDKIRPSEQYQPPHLQSFGDVYRHNFGA